GISATHTEGYHPKPARPLFSDLFNGTGEKQWEARWLVSGGHWEVEHDEVIQAEEGPARALIRAAPATHYLFEAGVKMSPETFTAGIYAWWRDENNFLSVLLDQAHRRWSYTTKLDGKSETQSFPLPPDFNYHAYHTICVLKNA